MGGGLGTRGVTGGNNIKSVLDTLGGAGGIL